MQSNKVLADLVGRTAPANSEMASLLRVAWEHGRADVDCCYRTRLIGVMGRDLGITQPQETSRVAIENISTLL